MKKTGFNLNPANKGTTTKRMAKKGGVKKGGGLKQAPLEKDIGKKTKTIKASKKGSSKRATAVKEKRQDVFALNAVKGKYKKK